MYFGKEKWIVFYHGEKELCAYTVRGTFKEELQNTLELLAYENDIPLESITTKTEYR